MSDKLNTAADHITYAKDELAQGGRPEVATAHALIAIAELMATNMTEVVIDATGRGAMAMAETVGGVFSAISPGIANPGPNVTVSEDEWTRCVVCKKACDASGLCDDHKYDGQPR